MSNKVIKGQSEGVRVLDFTPTKFEMGVPLQAMDYLDSKRKKSNDFKMGEQTRIQTGVDKIESISMHDEVNRLALEKLKAIQEGAYQEAYNLGLEQGRKEAFEAHSAQIQERLGNMEKLFTSVGSLKTELLSHNEAHLVKLAFHMAQRLANHEVNVNPDVVVSIIRQAVEIAQIEEEVIAQVNPDQLEFLEILKKETSREFEFLKKIKLVPMEGISAGGVVIETNYGVIDAQIEERVRKLWETISENLLRVKDKVSAA